MRKMKNEIKRQNYGKRAPTTPHSAEVGGQPGMVLVDSTWGEIQPMQIADEVQTIGELEVLKHIQSGLPLVDGRSEKSFREGTIPSAKHIPYTELNRDEVTILFCNGPQCPQSPWAIRALLEAGYPAEKILYYRGGMHDWVTLGFPVDVPL